MKVKTYQGLNGINYVKSEKNKNNMMTINKKNINTTTINASRHYSTGKQSSSNSKIILILKYINY
jgi:hypothetical protein